MRKLPQLKGEIKLDLGSSDIPEKGFVGIDLKDCGQEIIWDIRDGLPFPDNSVSEIFSCHMLEHLDEDEVIDLFREIYRVLKVGAIFIARVPYSNSASAVYIGHKSFWNQARIGVFERDKESELGKFAILDNEKVGEELFFRLKKI